MPYSIKMLTFEQVFFSDECFSQSKHGEVQLCWTGNAVEQLRGGLAGGLPRPLAAPEARQRQSSLKCLIPAAS